MKVLLTGASGFVGAHVRKALEFRGHLTTIVHRTNDHAQQSCRIPEYASNDLVFDLTESHTELSVPFGHYDTLIHVAWSGLPNYRSACHLAQVPRHLALVEAAIRAGIHNVVAIGTCFEYGMQSGSLSETCLPVPILPYAIAKNALREALKDCQQSSPFSLRWIRLFYLYGAGQPGTSLLPQLDAAIASGRATFPLSGGDQLRDYLDVATAAERIVRVAELAAFDGIVNVCSGVPIVLRDFVQAFVQKRQSSIALQFGALPYADYEPMEFWGDTTIFRRICGNA